jgi:hypothetical protein
MAASRLTVSRCSSLVIILFMWNRLRNTALPMFTSLISTLPLCEQEVSRISLYSYFFCVPEDQYLFTYQHSLSGTVERNHTGFVCKYSSGCFECSIYRIMIYPALPISVAFSGLIRIQSSFYTV